MTLKAVRWAVAAVGASLVALAIIASAGSRTATLRRLVVGTLADRLDSAVELEAFSVDTFPTVVVNGTGLVLRFKERSDIPPLVSVGNFAIDGGLVGLLSRPRRFRIVRVDGLEINLPPGGLKRPVSTDEAERSERQGQEESETSPSPISIDVVEAESAVLRLIPKRQGREPRVFAIHQLKLSHFGHDQRMPFRAELTNPTPKGLIEAVGTFGPWRKQDPAETPVEGRYTFGDVDLGTIDGIGGKLTSQGQFKGALGRIGVSGTTDTPDFRLERGGRGMPLSTRFEAVVDGTDGDTYLNAVNARLERTDIFAKGAVAGTPGVRGRTVKLHAKIDDGRIEDILKLAVRSDTPLIKGRLALHTDFVLPPGKGDVIERLELGGEFDLHSARFTDPDVSSKLGELSRRASGSDSSAAPDTIVSDLAGRFRLASGVLTFPRLRFRIPGAAVELAGSYGLRSEVIAFDGTLRMDATISEAAGGGMRSVFLKIVDPLFRKRGAGAVVPIRIRGTRTNPKFGVDMGRLLKSK